MWIVKWIGKLSHVVHSSWNGFSNREETPYPKLSFSKLFWVTLGPRKRDSEEQELIKAFISPRQLKGKPVSREIAIALSIIWIMPVVRTRNQRLTRCRALSICDSRVCCRRAPQLFPLVVVSPWFHDVIYLLVMPWACACYMLNKLATCWVKILLYRLLRGVPNLL